MKKDRQTGEGRDRQTSEESYENTGKQTGEETGNSNLIDLFVKNVMIMMMMILH